MFHGCTCTVEPPLTNTPVLMQPLDAVPVSGVLVKGGSTVHAQP